MLCSSVGRPNSPTCATYGGRSRGIPRLPSIDSIIADSSPQMYAPAPRRRWMRGSGHGGSAASAASSRVSSARHAAYSSRR